MLSGLVRAAYNFYFGLVINQIPEKLKTSGKVIRAEMEAVADRKFSFLRWFSPKMRDATKAVKVKAVLISRRQYLCLCHGCLLERRVQFVSEIRPPS
jgi:hypothetical protein